MLQASSLTASSHTYTRLIVSCTNSEPCPRLSLDPLPSSNATITIWPFPVAVSLRWLLCRGFSVGPHYRDPCGGPSGRSMFPNSDIPTFYRLFASVFLIARFSYTFSLSASKTIRLAPPFEDTRLGNRLQSVRTLFARALRCRRRPIVGLASRPVAALSTGSLASQHVARDGWMPRFLLVLGVSQHTVARLAGCARATGNHVPYSVSSCLLGFVALLLRRRPGTQ
ncbi:hypothetical protein XA68_10023 [Ophiocordyceps unilateralis]|uniref:Uncharacterized protein n=1 Tax=Ophiocordyceps unilateralis TaxID=268505 RepID=A0A2A9PV83_OPHUN|nr:hypothetical protein XA68_10023 [Ophiocordyceps unilateralis]